MKCYVCSSEIPIDGQVVLNVGAMQWKGDTAEIPDKPPLLPIFSVDLHDHENMGFGWDMADIGEHVSANGQADVHFCGPDCLDELFRRISAAVRLPHQ